MSNTEDKNNLKGSLMAFASYKAKPSMEGELMNLVNRHYSTLLEIGLVTTKCNYIAKSTDGRIIEVFEWINVESVNTAHKHPQISEIWEKMAEVSDFLPMDTLPESTHPFSSFEMIK